MAGKIRLEQLAQDGASDGEVCTWDAATSSWLPVASAGGVDTTAIHKATAAEISVITEKVTPVSADLLLIEDSADANAKKRVQVGNIPHDGLDRLVHQLAETSFDEATYTSGRLTNLTTWTTSGKTTKVRETQLTYTGGNVTTLVEIQYNSAGVEAERITETIAYSSGRLDTVTRMKT